MKTKTLLAFLIFSSLAAPADAIRLSGNAIREGSDITIDSMTVTNSGGNRTSFSVGTSSLVVRDGLVGVGTTAPAYLQHLFSGSASQTASAGGDTFVIENNGAAGLSILTTDAGSSNIYFGSANDAIGALISYNSNDQLIMLGSHNAGDSVSFESGDAVEAMRIDSSQRVGIGTTAPATRLDMAGTFSFNGVVAMSSAPIAHVSGFTFTLGINTTFQAFIPDSAITLQRITTTVVVAGIGGSGDEFFCDDGTNAISVTIPAAAVAGTITTVTGPVNVAQGATVNFRQQSAVAGDPASTTPVVNVTCEYSMQ